MQSTNSNIPSQQQSFNNQNNSSNNNSATNTDAGNNNSIPVNYSFSFVFYVPSSQPQTTETQSNNTSLYTTLVFRNNNHPVSNNGHSNDTADQNATNTSSNDIYRPPLNFVFNFFELPVYDYIYLSHPDAFVINDSLDYKKPASQTAIDKLEKVDIETLSNKESIECPICLDELLQKSNIVNKVNLSTDQIENEQDKKRVEPQSTVIDDIVRMDCNHIFHKQCLIKWLKIKNCCPLCRSEIEPEGNIKKQKVEQDAQSQTDNINTNL